MRHVVFLLVFVVVFFVLVCLVADVVVICLFKSDTGLITLSIMKYWCGCAMVCRCYLLTIHSYWQVLLTMRRIRAIALLVAGTKHQ